MPTANHDASILTKRRRNYALFTFNRLNSAAVNAGTSIRREQPDTQLQEVLAQRFEVSANTNPTASCPCDAATAPNTGGGNTKNVG